MNPDQIRRLTDVETPVLNGYHINENVKKRSRVETVNNIARISSQN